MTQKITKFDKRSVGIIQEAMNRALEGVSEFYGVTIEPRGGSFSPSGVSLKFDVSLKDEAGIGGKEADAFRQLAPAFGLKASDLGRTFVASGLTHTVAGCKTRGYRSILTKAENGKWYRFPAEMVKMYLERNQLGSATSNAVDRLIQS